MSTPAAWTAALALFRDAYGCEFDSADETDRAAIIPLLERAVHERYERATVEYFRHEAETYGESLTHDAS